MVAEDLALATKGLPGAAAGQAGILAQEEDMSLGICVNF